MMRDKIDSRGRMDDTSIKEFVLNIKDWMGYLISKWYLILLFALLGGGIGLAYAWKKKTVYVASTSFVLETNAGRGGGLSNYAGLASSFGIDLGSAGGGLFEGENILELYKSRTMISKALLSADEFAGAQRLLIDRYIDYNGLKKQWETAGEKNIKFKSDNQYANVTEQLRHDSIMSMIVKNISTSYLSVAKKDKKLNIIYVTVTSPDEHFSKLFNEKLTENVNRFYLETKTKKNLENVAILQSKADSVRGTMSGSISRAAAIADATPNQNPTRMAQRIGPIQNAKVNAEINQEVLGTILQNLELGKIALLKETPLIQIIDKPVLPLDIERFGKFKGLALGGVIGGILVVFFLVIRRIVKKALAAVPQ